jgi:hypothetical protein
MADQKAQKRTALVQEGGNVVVDGKIRKPGERLELTDEQITSLGTSVTTDLQEKKKDIPSKRLAGKYKVVTGVWLGKKLRTQGTIIDLSQQDARDCGEAVTAL